MSYEVKLTRQAEEDLLRLFDFVLARELERGGELSVAEQALAAITHGIATLRHTPWTCRKAAQNPFLRELVISYGSTGYVALFEITDSATVVVAAVRHQREDDYH
ncbi:MAG: type II toxin-antitoxin system RelE/ParE family toxin [Rhodoferax sp.]|uniref:type II toxin-antitoxin system RelE/ParE family toxin n=1 Tax=Rhodoferax sp. TaxID=50421 RepID=UPI00326461A5